MVSNSMIRKAREIVNRGDVIKVGKGQYLVTRKDTGTTALVFTYTDGSGRTRWVSDSQYFRRTGRQDTYITSAKLAEGMTVTA